MFEKESRSNVTSSTTGFLFISAVTLVVVFALPYLAIIHLSGQPEYISMGVGFIFQVIGFIAMFMVVRPVVEVAIHRLGLIRNLISRSPQSTKELINSYIQQKRSSEPVVVNVEVGEELDRTDGIRLYIEFISDTRFGVLSAEVDDLGTEEVEELSFIDKDEDYRRNSCKLSPEGTETLYSAPIFDSSEDTSAGFYRICEGCIESIMTEANERIEEKSSELVMKTI